MIDASIKDLSLPIEVVRKITQCASLRMYSRGEMLFNVGDEAPCVYLIRRGRVKMCHIAENGDVVTYFPHLEGELVGLGGVVDEQARTAMAVVDSENCCLWQIPAAEFKRLMRTDPQVSYFVAVMAVKRFGVLGTQYRRHVSMGIRERLPAVLLELASRTGISKNGTTVIKITQQDLADIMGVCRQRTSSVIQTLKAEGILETRRGYIVIVDIQKLREAAGRSLVL